MHTRVRTYVGLCVWVVGSYVRASAILFVTTMLYFLSVFQDVESSLQALSLCIVLVSPHADSPLCQERLMEACRTLAGSIEHLCHSAQVGGCEETLVYNSMVLWKMRPSRSIW